MLGKLHSDAMQLLPRGHSTADRIDLKLSGQRLATYEPTENR